MNRKSKIILQFFSLTLLLLCVFSGNKKEANIKRWEMAEKEIPSKNTRGFVQETQKEVKVSLESGKETLSPVIQKVTESYTELLLNYDRVLHDPSYDKGNGTGWGIDENMVYDRVLRHVGKEVDEVEISKKEYEDIQKELTKQPLEIDWQPLEGFWQGE